MTSYLERATVARAVKVRVIDEWSVPGRANSVLAAGHEGSQRNSVNGFDGNGSGVNSPDPGPQFPGNRLEPAT